MWIDYAHRIRESVSELEAEERRLRGLPTEARVKMLRLLKSGAFRSRRALAPLLGYSERQLQRWWDAYSRGGLKALLEYQPRGGSQERLTPEAREALEEEMKAGRIARLKDAQAYLKEHWGLSYSIAGLSRLFQRHKIKRKTGRRRHRKASEEEQKAFKKNFGEQLRERQAERVFAMDEARFGLKVWHRRRWCPQGVRPPWIYEDRYEWLWLYAAVEPLTGEFFFLFLPRLDGECFRLFLEEFRAWYVEEIVLILDNSGSHRSRKVKWPKGLQGLHLPSYSPELNPTEGIFKDLRGELANEIFDDVKALEQRLLELVQRYREEPERLQRLTAYPWWVEGVRNIQTLS